MSHSLSVAICRSSMLVVLLLLLPGAAPAGDGGFSLQLRASDLPGAPVAAEVLLYAESYALVIGIDEYTAGWPRLSNAVKDAEIVAELLRNRGFDVRLEKNIGGRALERVLKEFFIKRGQDPDARLFVWFAGHGHSIEDEGYLVPADAPRPQDGIANFRFAALSMRRFGELVRQADSKHVFAVFDSCFSGTIFDSSRSMPPPAITRATAEPVRQFLSSGDAGQVVSDDGMFRELFVDALAGRRGADANQDGYLTGTELSLFLAYRISNYTDNAQTPRYGKLRDPKYDRGDFVFVLDRRESGAAPEPTPNVPSTEPASPVASAPLSISGCWDWFNGPVVVIRDDGTVVVGNSPGKWYRKGDGTFEIAWAPFIDTLTLGQDRKTLSGTNNHGWPIFVTRTSGPRDGILGLWTWPTGTVTISEGGSFLLNGAPLGSWKALSNDRFELEWSTRVIDTLRMTSDGSRLDGLVTVVIPPATVVSQSKVSAVRSAVCVMD